MSEMLEAALVEIISQKMAHLIEFENEIQYERIRKSKSYNIATVTLQAVSKALQEIKTFDFANLVQGETVSTTVIPRPLGTLFSSSVSRNKQHIVVNAEKNIFSLRLKVFSVKV